MLAIIRRLTAESGATVLLCTHLLAEVEETCTRVRQALRELTPLVEWLAEVLDRDASGGSPRE